MAQINKAMTLVDQVTQRNASASEELASTAEEMTAQAEALQQTISFFKTAGDAAAAAPRPAVHARPAHTVQPFRGRQVPMEAGGVVPAAAFAEYTHF